MFILCELGLQGVDGTVGYSTGVDGTVGHSTGVDGTVEHSAGGGWDSDTDRTSVRALTNVLSTSDSEISSK